MTAVFAKYFLFTVSLLALFGAQGALATKPLPMLGQSNKTAISAYAKQNNTHEKLTAQEAEFWKEKLEYDEIQTKLWPLCTEVKSDVAQDCKNLSAAELKTSYPDESIGGLGARYRVSKEEAEVLRQRRSQLENKWSGK